MQHFGVYISCCETILSPGQVKMRAFMKILLQSCGQARLNEDLCWEVLKFGQGLFA